MIGLALLAFLEVLSASTLAPMLREYARDRADFEVSPAFDPSTKGDGTLMEPAVVDRLRACRAWPRWYRWSARTSVARTRPP